ncbi:MAG TPA: histidine kinase [Puia sp.]|nr:histidine kinase [Puia sp.]
MAENGFLREIILSSKYRWLRHVLLCIGYFIWINLLDYNRSGNLRQTLYIFLFFYPLVWVYLMVIIYWLIPSFLLKGKYLSFFGLYIGWCCAGLSLIFLIKNYAFGPALGVPPPQHVTLYGFYHEAFTPQMFMEINILPTFCVFFKLFKFWYMEQQQKDQIEKEKLNAELQLLKAQLHPHFLFNTLNNLYSLVHEKSDKAPKMLMRLADLLSYVLYECKADEVLLSRELNFIRDYILLEKERYLERLDVSLNFSGDIGDRMIAPMLFQPFIENAFKHGTSEQLGKVWMSIDLSVKQSQLYFKVINSCDKNHLGAAQKGIGIDNIRKRLDLLYPGRFELQYGPEDDVYIASLSLELITPVKGHPVFEGIPAVKQAQ